MKSKQNNQSKPKTVRRCRTVMVMLLIIALVIPQAVLAANEGQGAESVSAPLLTAGDPISITLSKSLASNAENGYEVSGSILTFNANAHGKAYIISQETGHGFTTITVSNNVNADITINSISMNSFALSAGANVNLALKGNNTMSYGLRVPSNATVSIDDNGDKTAKLTAAGYYNCAAIGGGAMRESCGTINILGGTITANGGGNAAAIGGGCFASGGNITISGGTVTANGIVGGAGIGGGHGGNGGTIKITGGTVTANQTNAASTAGTGAGIGGGTDAAGGAITISGGTVKAAAVDGAAIGMGADEGNNGNRANDTNIKITGGTVTATASGRGAAIGGGRRYGGGTIEISGAANVTATGGNSASGGAGIGSGYDGGAGAKLTLASTATVKAYSRNTACQAINAASVSGDAYFINAQLNTERTAVTKLKAYGPDGAGVNTDLSLPANYPNFAYTTGSAQPQENYILAFNDSTNIFEGMIVPTLNNEGNTICTVQSVKNVNITGVKFQANTLGSIGMRSPARDAINGDSVVLRNAGSSVLDGLMLPQGSVAGFEYGASSELSSGTTLLSWDDINSRPKGVMPKELEPNTKYYTRNYIDIVMGSKHTRVDASAIVSFATLPKITTAAATQDSEATKALLNAGFHKSEINNRENNAPITDVEVYVSGEGISYTEGFACVQANGNDITPSTLKNTDFTDDGITDYVIDGLTPNTTYNILVVATNEGGKDGKLFQYRGTQTLRTVSYISNKPVGASGSVTGDMFSQTGASQGAGLTLSPNAFTLLGYNFQGWNTARLGAGTDYSDGATIPPESLTSDMTLFAQWKLKEVKVTYLRNDGTSDSHVSETVDYDSPIAAAPSVPIREGYSFDGWYRETGTTNKWAFGANGTIVNAANGVEGAGGETPTLSLYAKWVKHELALTADDGQPLTASDYSYTADGVLTIKSGRAMTIGMAAPNATTTTDRIVIATGDVDTAADITLKDVSIILPADPYAPAFNVDGSTLNLTLKGTNVLTSGWNCAGLQLVNNANLVITEASDSGALTATCTKDAAGIGGGSGSGTAGNITINGGTITARNTRGAGSAIGGGYDSSVGDITINGGTVNATVTVNLGGYGGAGIGGGYSSNASGATAGNITIDGGTVMAQGGRNAAGIGGGYKSSGAGNILITGGKVTATHVSGDSWGAGIGGGEGSSVGTITITGGEVNATGGAKSGEGGSGIGAGYSANAGNITISGGTVTAKRLDGSSLDIGNGVSGGVAASVTITGGSVWAVNGAIAPAPKNAVDGGAAVYANKLDFDPALEDGTAITLGSIDGIQCTNDSAEAGGSVYGIRDIKAIKDPSTSTDKKVRVCLWLPDNPVNTATATLRAGSIWYQKSYSRAGALGPQTLTPVTTPGIMNLLPSGKNVSVSGDIVIAFATAMNTSSSGTVSLTKQGGDPVPLMEQGSWDDDGKVYTIPYADLDGNTVYTVTVAGFKTADGTNYPTDSTHSFTTITESASAPQPPGGGDGGGSGGGATPPATTYSVIEQSGTYTGSGKWFIKIGADHTKFVRLFLEDREVDPSNYTVTQGSTIITLHEGYLKTFVNGTYRLRAIFKDGTSENISLVVDVRNSQTPDEDKAVAGWKKIKSKWYYFGLEDGVMKWGWQKIKGKWYYLGDPKDGAMKWGWQKIKGKWYYLGGKEDGAMKAGWKKINSKWYYFGGKEDGAMKAGWKKINSKWYYFGGKEDGAMKASWKKINSKWYYFGGKEDGAMKADWKKINGKWYYFGGPENGAMKTGWQKISGKRYRFNSSGAWVA